MAAAGGAESEAPTPEERAALALFSIEGIGPVTLGALRAHFGSLAQALSAPRDELAARLRDDATRARLLAAGDLLALADRHLERARRLKARVLFSGRPDWPRQLAGDEHPPVLYVLGRLDPQALRVAIVGSREPDAYGEEVTTYFAASLARGGVSIVSGGAVGIDAAAHRACLGNSGATVAVLGTGLDGCYPPEHRVLFNEIVARGGALVSQFPPGSPAVPQNFVVRNRLIAGLSDAVLVTRAGATSGALSTARAATALGRPLFAVPGDVTCPLSAGANGLLEAGKARAATGPAPLAALLGLKGEPDRAQEPAERPRARSAQGRGLARPEAPQPLPSEIPQELREVWQALAHGPRQFDELLACCGLDAGRLANALLRLELNGLCEERVGKVFARR